MKRLPTISYDVIKKWKNELSDVHEGEVVKIVSGEVNCDLYKEIKDDIYNAFEKKKIEFRSIGGPIISVDENGSNALLNLVKDGVIKFWISPTRRLRHYRVFGDRLAYIEDYHQALDEDRTGQYIDNKMKVYQLSCEFDDLIDALEMPPFNNNDSYVLTSKKTLLKVQKLSGINYDFLTANEFKKKAADIN